MKQQAVYLMAYAATVYEKMKNGKKMVSTVVEEGYGRRVNRLMIQ